MNAPKVFISYSQDSDEHNARVLELANRLRADGIDAAIDQYESSPAEGWPKWMDRHIAKDDFVLVICTETYYRRVMGEEEMGKGRGIKWESTLSYQHIYDNDSLNTRFIPVLFDGGKTENVPTPLKGATFYFLPSQYDKLYYRLISQPETVKPKLGKLKPLPPRQQKTDYLGIKISLAHLPSTSPDLFGRENELALLDAAWSGHVILSEAKNPLAGVETLRSAQGDMPKVNVVTLVAWGGVGKSALVNKWLTQMARDAQAYRGAERVYGWSFYSQGAAEGRQVSADQFIASALAWFGDPDPNLGSPWDKGERLAELVKVSRALIVLDGLEPLQNPPPVETGRIKDPALVAFLRELAVQNLGLVVITTRLAVEDLKQYVVARSEATKQPPNDKEIASGYALATTLGTVLERDLDNLSPEAGATYLSHLGVNGSDTELQDAVRDFGGHALALTLMGRYLADIYDGDVRKRDLIPHLTDEEEKGGHAKRIMRAYEKWFEGKPERDLLTLMGLFDRPAEKGAMDALLATPVIDGLTDKIQGLPAEKYKLVLKHLRKARLLAEGSTGGRVAASDSERRIETTDELDCHPLLREHFGEQLKATNPAAWREGNNRLYEWYKTSAKELPDTLQEMAPLFAAVMHGCQAGRYQETILEVYWKRIQRKDKHFTVKQLGAIGSDLTLLSGFFDLLWQKPISELGRDIKGLILNQAGFDLRALGRLIEAAQPMETALNLAIILKDWINASICATGLSGLYTIMGNTTNALKYANQSIELANRSNDTYCQIAARTLLGDSLHQAGRLTEAEAVFHEAERILKEWQPQHRFFVGMWGIRYCDLLLSQGNFKDVQEQTKQRMDTGKDKGYSPSLFDIALDNLILARAYLLQSQRDSNYSFTKSLPYLNYAVDGLRKAGAQEFIVRGLLARAEYYRVTGELYKSQKDLDEAFSIATRSGMGLHLADCHLEYARLSLARGVDERRGEAVLRPHHDDARAHLSTAKEMITKMGYHRRDKEVEELEKAVSL